MKGIPTSSGIALAKAFIYKEPKYDIRKETVDNIEDEITRLESAVKKGASEIEKLYDITLKTVGQDEAEIFNAHKMMIEDPEFIGAVKEKIGSDKLNAEFAVNEVSGQYVAMFEAIEDEYLRERAADLRDISKRLLRILLGLEEMDLAAISEDSIIVAEDLTPSDTAQMNKDKVKGFVTELGGKTAHTSIIARTLGIPSVSGIEKASDKIKQGDFIILDGIEGHIFVNPDSKLIEDYRKKKEAYEGHREKLKKMIGKESLSKDGRRVELAANIGTPKDLDGVLSNDAEGVGLYRTEFLYMDRDKLPTEEEQFQAYKEVAEALEGKPLVIRSLDVGGDKDLPYLDLPKELNPFLGYRAIRLCLDQRDIFETQLRAILRASAYGDVKIMFPMISNLTEVRQAKALVEEIKADLRREKIDFNEDIEIGIMVEIPAVAIHGDAFAKEVDFFSIGTNDLIQYSLAVDRGNQNISYLYNQFHPAVLRLIKMTIDAGHRNGIWVGMCGEVAGDPKLIPILLGMGLDEFSMSASSILEARSIIRNTSKEEMEAMVDEILDLPTAEDVEVYIEKEIR